MQHQQYLIYEEVTSNKSSKVFRSSEESNKYIYKCIILSFEISVSTPLAASRHFFMSPQEEDSLYFAYEDILCVSETLRQQATDTQTDNTEGE